MQFLTEEDVKAFYAEVIGVPEIRRKHSAFGQDAYPTISLKAAALMHSLAENQPFVDGNKRIAWICAKAFLQLHGLKMQATDDEALDLFTKRIAN